MQVKVVIGTVAFMLTMIIFGYAALREPARLEHFTGAAVGRSVETGAELYVNNCANCHGEEGKAETCKDPGNGEIIGCQGIPLNNKALVCGEEPERLEIMGWIGSKRDFVYTTISAGRGQIMPTWSANFGGPMRNDQVVNLTDYVLNFEGDELCNAPDEPKFPWPETAEEFLASFPDGDAARGAELYEITYGCAACHGALDDSAWTGTGPWLGNIADIAPNRIPEYSLEQYLYESILEPGVYVVDGYTDG
ncbi:MAG: hypothetical protein DWQ04_02515, partial [Chloroflexi bacterium]